MPEKKFSFIDLFAGIGGFRLGLEAIGGDCIASSEIDRHANQVYANNWPNDSEQHHLGDICQVGQLPPHDLMVGGVPCQAWSIAGKNRGIEDPRGKLWLEVIRLLGQSTPTAFIFENVKGLHDQRHRAALDYLVDSFTSFGYEVHYRLLNSFDFDVPQNRERIFIVGIQKSRIKKAFVWPRPVENHKQLFEILDDLEKPCFTEQPALIQRNLFGERVNVSHNKLTPIGAKNQFFILTDLRDGPTSIHSWELYDHVSEYEKEICLTILRNRRKPQYGPQDGNPMSFADLKMLIPGLKEEYLQRLMQKRILRQYEDSGKYEFFNRKLSGGIDGISRVYLPTATFFPTIMASGTLDFVATVNVHGDTDEAYKADFIRKVLHLRNYRALKSSELARLQGFPSDFKRHDNPRQNIKLFGNSVAVPVITAVGKAIMNTGCFDNER
ncbi:MAG: DNA cytosine methyltransferase [Chloroflexota bacterium]